MLQKFSRRVVQASLSFFFLPFFANLSSAQTLLTTGFENAVLPSPPPDWIVTHTGTANWQSLTAPVGGGNQQSGHKCMFLQNNADGSASDAWLISPSVSLQAGKKYSISFYYKNQSYQGNRLQVTLGSDTLPASQTEILWEKGFKTNFYSEAQINYTPTTTGIRYIGIHCNTPSTRTYVYIDNFEVSAVKAFEPVDPQVKKETTTTALATWNTTEGASQYEYGVNDNMTPPVRTLFTTDKYASLTTLIPATHFYFYVRSILAGGQKSNWALIDFSTSYDTTGIETLNCRRPVSNTFRANEGLYREAYCDDIYFSKEFFHRFIPEQTGMYNLNIYAVNTGQYMTFLYKDAALGAGAEGWNCIGGANDFGGKYTFGPLEKGKEYLIMEKAKAAPGFPSSYSYGIDCYAPPPENDECSNATKLDVTAYNDSCRAVRFTTQGALSTPLEENFSACGYGVADDDIWASFTALSNMQLFRFRGMNYFNTIDPHANPGIYFNIYSNPCDLKSLVDCGYVPVNPGETKDIVSYKLQKGQTYYCRIFTADEFSFASFGLCVMNVPVSNGIANNCLEGLPYSIDQYTDRNNSRSWVPMLDDKNGSYRVISEVNARGSTLNYTTGSVYVNTGALRRDADNRYYLDRNVHFTAEQQPSSPVSIRVIISNGELNRLITQAGSQVSSLKDIRITQNEDACAATVTKPATSFIVPYRTGDFDAHHKFVEFETSQLSSSFYLHGGNTALRGTGFTTTPEGNSATTQQTVAFAYPNPFKDKITLIMLETTIATCKISLTDMSGRTLQSVSTSIAKGSNTLTIETGNIKPGIYLVKIEKRGTVQYIKLVKE